MPAVLFGPQDLLDLGYGQAKTSPAANDYFRRRDKRRRRAATTPGIARMRELMYPFVHGVKTRDGPRPSITKEELIARWNGGRVHAIPRLPNYKLVDHAASGATFYFWNKPDSRETLFMIDVDVKKSKGLGTAEGARDFAKYLDRHVVPGCHWEASTGGIGMQGFGILRHAEPLPARDQKALLDKMERDLAAVARCHGADIELVEVKGHPPVVNRGGRNHARNLDTISSMTYGQFAKIPRDLAAVARLEPVSLDALGRLAEEARAAEPEAGKKAGKKCGSCTGRLVSQEMLSVIPRLERIGESVLAGRRLAVAGSKVLALDAACAILLVFVLGRGGNANEDGSMPTRRIKALWDALRESGDFARAWNPNRFKVVRDLLSEAGLIRWTDETYQHLPRGGGRACKWRLTDEMAALVEGLLESASREADGGEASSGKDPLAELFRDMPRTGRNLRPVRVWAVRRILKPDKKYLREYRLAA